MIKLITTASDNKKTEKLRQSLEKYGWNYTILAHDWRGFGDKIIQPYNYLKANPGITHFFYTDSYDTIVTKGMQETLMAVNYLDGILLSAERACYPHPDKAARYPENDSPFKYVNGGGWFCNSLAYIKAYEENPLTVETVDQVWFTDLFLNNDNVKLDYNCDVFQTIAFCPEDNFTIDKGKVLNTITNTYPTFIHGNGHTPMGKFYEL